MLSREVPNIVPGYDLSVLVGSEVPKGFCVPRVPRKRFEPDESGLPTADKDGKAGRPNAGEIVSLGFNVVLADTEVARSVDASM